MDDDVIVVDDVEHNPPPVAAPSAPPTVPPPSQPTLRLRSANNPPQDPDRPTRSTNAKSKIPPKLKLKLGEKAASQAPGMSFLGQYDRELDSSDDDLAFEEQFILRMPPGEDLDKMRKMVASREVSNDVWFKFKGVLCAPASRPRAYKGPRRLAPCRVPYCQQSLFCQAS